jgi:hypothetical protein
MNKHRSLGFLAALFITVAQLAFISTGTASAAQNTDETVQYQA